MNIGSETVGDFSNISFRNIDVTSAGQSGIGIVSMDGASIADVSYSNITMTKTATPIYMFVGARQRRPPPRRVGSIARVRIEDVRATDCFSDRHGRRAHARSALSSLRPSLPPALLLSGPDPLTRTLWPQAQLAGRSLLTGSRATPRAT